MNNKILSFVKVFFAVVTINSCSHEFSIKEFTYDNSGINMYGRVPERNFWLNVYVKDSLELLWEAETSGSQSNTSVITNGNFLFVCDLSGRIYCFNMQTGKSLGYYKYNGAISVAPVINKLRIYFVVNLKNESFSIFVMKDIVSGKTLSEIKIEGSINNEMLKLEDGIIILSDHGELIKINFAGVKEWSLKTKQATHCIAASDGKVIAFGNDAGELIFVSVNEGIILSRQKISDYPLASITIDYDLIFFTDASGKLFCYDYTNKKLLWQFKTGSNIRSIPVFNSKSVFVGNLSGKIYSIRKNDGKLLWLLDTKGIINTTPLLLRNYLIQPDFNKKIYFINQENGQIIRTLYFESRIKLTPVIFDDIIFFGVDRGKILAYRIFYE